MTECGSSLEQEGKEKNENERRISKEEKRKASENCA
jgi:hypothetical protein